MRSNINTKKLADMHTRLDHCLELDFDYTVEMFKRMEADIQMREAVISYEELLGLSQCILWDAISSVLVGQYESVKVASEIYGIDINILSSLIGMHERLYGK